MLQPFDTLTEFMKRGTACIYFLREIMQLDFQCADRRAQLMRGIRRKTLLAFKRAVEATDEAVDGLHDLVEFGRYAALLQRH